MIRMYGQPNCIYCDKAKALAKLYNLNLVYFDIKVNRDDFRRDFPDATTVPQIIMNGKAVGGYTEFAAEIEDTLGGYGDSGF